MEILPRTVNHFLRQHGKPLLRLACIVRRCQRMRDLKGVMFRAYPSTLHALSNGIGADPVIIGMYGASHQTPID
ncbi:hypothetical protein JOE11_004705 [Robbsia andropogonis]